ncbi:MAG: hypothetical protein ABI867_39180 [Kofleriaceae bacterium]
MHLAVVVALALIPGLAAAAPCTFDRRVAGVRGFSDSLRCNGQKVDDMSISVGANGAIIGISWNEYQGSKLDRTITLYETGAVVFIAHDESIQGGYSAKTRMVMQYVFPRRQAITVERGSQGLLTIRDHAGNAWLLVPIRVPDDVRRRTSYLVASVARANMSTVPIELGSRRGVAGIDLGTTPVMWMQHERLSMGGFDDTRSQRYKKLKSTFHDGKGGSCAVANADLFVPSTVDPKDKFDDKFRFTDDGALAEFLATACPKLDLAALQR